MMIVTSSRTDINYDELAALKQLAQRGALEEEVSVTSRGLSQQLHVSSQTVSRRLQRLENEDLISRQVGFDGQQAVIEEAGKRTLRREYQEYKELFEAQGSLIFEGTVVDGMGEGGHYISLEGYVEQFRNRLGYEPFAGTLNIELDEESVAKRSRLDTVDAIQIEEWNVDDRTYGAAECYRATVEPTGRAPYESAHLLVPVRSQHGDDTIEIIAPDKLRDAVGLDDGDEVTIHVLQ